MRWLIFLMIPLLAGCTDAVEPESVILNKRLVGAGSSAAAGLDCTGSGSIQIVHESIGSGSLTVRVRDGAGVPVWSQDLREGGAATIEESLGGSPGRWQLIVDRTIEFNAEFTATMSC